jgi:hypothetical protein
MNITQNPFGSSQQIPMNPYQQIQQIQQMFPQPQGSVYAINSPLDIGNVPIGSTGLSVAISLSDNLMYIKSFQNGQPIIMSYRITPFQKEEKKQEEVPEKENELTSRLAALEEKINLLAQGGKFDGLL